MKIDKIEKNGRYLRIYCKITWFKTANYYCNYWEKHFKDIKNYSSFEPMISSDGKYEIFEFLLRDTSDVEKYIDNYSKNEERMILTISDLKKKVEKLEKQLTKKANEINKLKLELEKGIEHE